MSYLVVGIFAFIFGCLFGSKAEKHYLERHINGIGKFIVNKTVYEAKEVDPVKGE